MWWMVLLACTSSGNVELRSQRRALDAWEDGRAALEKGHFDAARSAFGRGLDARPGDPLLLAWRARAEAEAGAVEEAITTLDRVLEAQPDFAEARYHRAAYLARVGRPEEAGPDLRRALEEGAGSPVAALKDDDFRSHRDHDAFSFLPTSALVVTAEPLPERAFRGSDVPVIVGVEALVEPDALMVEGLVHGPASLRRSVEDRTATGAGIDVSIRWDLTLTAPGVVVVGPLSFRMDGDVHNEPARTVASAGSEGEAEGASERWRLSSPTQLGAGLALDEPQRRGGRVWVRTEVTSQVSTTPPKGVLARHERRTEGQPDWVVWELADVKQVVVRGVGGQRFSGAPKEPPARR